MGAGFSPNMIEVGGKQTATMNGVGNTVRSSCNPPILELLAIPRLAAPLVVLTKVGCIPSSILPSMTLLLRIPVCRWRMHGDC